MSSTATQTIWTLASFALRDAYTDFVLTRQAMQCAPAPLEFYKHTAGKFVSWLDEQSVNSPQEVMARHVREFLAELAGNGKSDTTIHDNARAIKTLLRFWHAEKYMPVPVTFAMPKVAKKRLPVLSADDLSRVISACPNPLDKALILFMADSGLRRAETIALNWGDVDMTSGLVTVRRGKGGKARSAVIGASSRRALLQYRRTLKDVSDNVPPHALRRTFVILSHRADMDVLHLQAMLGHASLDMVQHYAQIVDDDLLRAHKAHSPIDNLSRLKEGR